MPAEPTNATDGTNDWWRIAVTTGLPPVDAPQTTVDGTAYDFTDGTTVVDPNPTTLGTGGTVGVDGLALPQVAGPELELLGDMVVNTGLGVSDEGDNSIVRRLAISRFQFDGLTVTGSLTNKLTGVLVEENVIGSGPSAFVDPGAGNRQSRSLQAYHTETSGTIRNNLIGFGSSYSVAMTFSSRDLTFEGNEIGGASAIGVSVSLSGSQVSGDITLRGNLIGDTFGSAVSLYRSYGSNTLENNTITNSALNSAVNVYGAGNRITKNVITGNGGAAIAVAGERPITAPTWVASADNLISQNIFGNNGGLAIDLVESTDTEGIHYAGDGITLTAGTIDTTGNNGVDAPVISTASVTTVAGTACTNCDVEVYKAIAGAGDGAYGEGVEFVGITTADGSGDWTLAGITTLTTSDEVTSIAIDGSNDTSEFGFNAVVVGPLIVNSTGDQSDIVLGDGKCYAGVLNSQGLEACTMRAAIQEANALAGADTIEFDIPVGDGGHSGGVWTITLGSVLPTISTTITIDGTTQPGWSSTPVVELNGNSAGGTADGFTITGDNVEIRSLAVNRFGDDAFNVDAGASGTVIAGNHIGTDPSGLLDLGNGGSGIDLGTGSGLTLVGGTAAADRNIISGNGNDGIIIFESDGNTVVGNYIGTDITGNAPLPNAADGIALGSTSSNNIIGQPGAGNVLSGNTNDGLELDNDLTGNIVQSNIIGLGADGNTPVPNGRNGLVIYDGVNSTQIGGTGAGEGNVISGNTQSGIAIDGNSNVATTANVFEGNYIGTDSTGMLNRGNGANGIQLFSDANGNTIGGTTAAHRNVISGNTDHGIDFSGTGTDSNTVIGNYIGTDVAGTADLGNGSDGVAIRSGAQGNTIGGTTAGHRNIISGNDNDGVWITGSGTTLNTVRGNWIGVAADGSPLGNSYHGVAVEFEASDNLVGGIAAGAGNRIEGNAWDGVAVNGGDGDGNAIIGNSISSNVGLGIDIDNNGVTPNDPGDGDGGDNDQLNFPVITSATETAGTVTVNFDLDVPNGSYRVEFFANAAADLSGHGEGETWISSVDVSVIGGVPTPATHNFPGSVGSILSATATEGTAAPFGSTSEFSANYTVTAGNNPPVFDQDILDRVEAEATWVSLSSAATDPDVGDTLTYSATGLPLGLSIDTGTGLISGLVNYFAAASSPSSVEITVCDDGTPSECDSDTFTWTITNVPTTDPYVVANTGGAGGGDDLLTEVDPLDVDPVTNEVDIGIGTGTDNLHAMSIEPISGVVYAASGGQLGTLNTDSGVFTPIGVGFGSGDGLDGTVNYTDVRGLTFHPLTGVLYAVHRRAGDRDVLFTVDPVTGLAVADAFLFGLDYLEVRSGSHQDVTDIAIDPTDWAMYGIVTDGAGSFELRVIRRWIASTNKVGDVTPEIRGLSFDAAGQMWGTDLGTLYEIDKTSGTTSNPRTLDNGSDYHAVALTVPPYFPPSVEGVVFEDVAGDAVPSGEDIQDFLNPGVGGVTVRMYRDDGTNPGEPDAGDTLYASTTTGPTGHYYFSSVPATTYWLTVDSSDVAPTAGGSGWAEQTYGPAEAVSFSGGYGFAATAGPLYGGMRPTVSDDASLLPTSEHVARVVLNPGDVIEQVDFGFSFNAVTNIAGGDGTSPQGSLRQFITNANTGTGPNPMRFVPVVATNATDGGSNNWWSLAVTSSLPALTDSGTTIDGSAFDAADGVTALNSNVAGPELELEGSGAGGNGLEITAGSSKIREVVVNGFGTGIAVLGGDANVIAGNYLGPDATGSVGEVGNTSQGLFVYGATNTVIGGSSIFDRNVISGNRLRGVFIDDYSDGAPAISNGTQVIGNFIGTNAIGSAALPYDSSPQYQQIGLAIWAGPDNVIGTATAGNVISGNSWHGVYIWGADATGNKIQGNTIGLDAGGSTPVPNGYDSITRAGIHISSAPGNLIGGIGAEGNVIVSNAARGVVIFGAAAVDNAIIGNTIYDNGDIGIDLQLDGVTLNDPGDADNTAANDLLNFPEITSALESAGVVTVLGTFDLPPGDYRFEFFVNPSGADSSGYGEGQSLVHSYAVVAHPGGSAPFSTSFAGSAGDVITATATEDLGAGSYGSTSEFSLAVVSSGAPLIVNSTGDASDLVPGNGACDTGTTIIGGDPECTLRAAIEEANDPSTSADTIWFAIPATDLGHAAGVWTIAPGSDLPEITAAVTLDATTQPEWSALPVIELDGSSLVGALAGIRINSSDVILRGFAVGNFPADGISVAGDDVTIAAMNIGVGADGSTDTGNGAGGIVVTTGDRVTIGGSDPLDRNIIGNSVSAAITVNDSDDSVIRGNYIGVQVDGVTPAPNSEGIHVSNSANLQIGGAGTNEGNVISGNTWEGIRLDTLTDGAQVRGNLIGVGADGSTPVGNGWIGVYNMTGSTGAIIGGRNPGEANTIAYNGDAGVRVLMSAQLAQIVGNRIHDNVGLGIDVGIGGVNPPDPGDVDGHPNQPVLLTARSSGGSTTVDLAFDRVAGDYLIDFYSNPGGGDPSGYGEGAQLIATISVTHDGSGPKLLRYVVPVSGSTITTTATSVTFLETSEFSNAIDDVAVASTLVSDSSIRRSDLYSAQATPTVVPGVAGGAHDLDGVSDHLVGPSLDVTDSALTISGWVQLDAAIGQQSLISKRDGSGNVVYELGVDGGTNEAVATVRLSGAPVTVRGGVVSTAVWKQISASWDGAELVLYVDGSEVDRAPAAGALDTDATTRLTIGARDDGTRRLDGRVDHVSVGHDSLSAAEVAVQHVNVGAPAVLVTLGDEQTGVPGTWTATTDQSRSGSYSLAAPETAGPATAAWAVATGIDEPGLVFESWWWMSTATGVDFAAGTRAGPVAVDQYSGAGVGSPFAWELRHPTGTGDVIDGNVSAAADDGCLGEGGDVDRSIGRQQVGRRRCRGDRMDGPGRRPCFGVGRLARQQPAER